MKKTPQKRMVVVFDDYLDGIMGLTAREPNKFDQDCRLVDAALLDELEAREKAFRAAEDAVRQAFAAAKDVRNPQYEPEVEG